MTMNQDTTQSEALRLAAWLKLAFAQMTVGDALVASNELTRLHAENQTLRSGYDAARLEIESLKKERDNFRDAFNDWHEKTEWVQKTATAHELGKHRADVLRERIASLEAQISAGPVAAKCLHQIAEPNQKPVAFGSAEEFASSDDPHCKDGGKACIDCLMCGECLYKVVEPKPAAAQEPMFWVRLTDSGGYEGPLHRSGIEDAHKKSGAWTPLYTEPQPLAVDGATLAGLISSEGHLSTLVDQMRALLVEVEDVCGHDDRGFEFEDGESEIIDKIRAMLAATNAAPMVPAVEQKQPTDGRLYAAINNLLAHCGAEGSIDAGHPFVTEAMDALDGIGGGVYTSSMATASSTDRVICKDEQISTAFNTWFESLPSGRKSVLIGDKWMLARAAFEAAHGITAA